MKKIIISTLLLFLMISGVSVYASNGEVPLIPKMTKHQAPKGEAMATSEFSSSYSAVQAFDQNDNTYWASKLNVNQAKIGYTFDESEVVTSYSILQNKEANRSPKDFAFEAWNGTDWVVLDSRSNVTNWVLGETQTFSFDNSTPYNQYRLNIFNDNGGQYISISELQFYGPAVEPENPTRGILTITLVNGIEKEYDLTYEEIVAFTNWYDAKDAGTGSARFGFSKAWIGPFKSRTEYVIFEKIIMFEIEEYEEMT